MYLLFAGYQYYPAGGWEDRRHMVASVDEAEQWFEATDYDWWHIVDLGRMKICGSGRR